MIKLTQPVPFVTYLSSLHGDGHFVILLRALTYRWYPNFHTPGDWHLVRIHPALQLESLKYALEERRAAGEQARWLWAEQWTLDSILWATGSHWKVSCWYLTHPPVLSQSASQQNREQNGWNEVDINWIEEARQDVSCTVTAKDEEKFLLNFRDLWKSREGSRDEVVRQFMRWSEESQIPETHFFPDRKTREIRPIINLLPQFPHLEASIAPTPDIYYQASLKED